MAFVLCLDDRASPRDISWPRRFVATTVAPDHSPANPTFVCHGLGQPAIGTLRAFTLRMLRIITVEMESGTKALQLSGSISDEWVQELRDCCETWLAAGNVVTLDLKDVQYADHAGLSLISQLRSRNVIVVRWTPLVASLLDAHETQRAGSTE